MQFTMEKEKDHNIIPGYYKQLCMQTIVTLTVTITLTLLIGTTEIIKER